MISQIRTFFEHIFFEAEDWRFEGIFENMISHYKKEFPDIALDEIWIGIQYTPSVSELLRSIKFEGHFSASKVFVAHMRQLATIIGINTSDHITFVPSHWTRTMMRDGNLAEFLAKSLGKWIVNSWLKKSIFIQHQSHLSKEKRYSNIQGVFNSIKIPETIPERMYLVDDVVSTGATLHECAKLLKNMGVREVIAVVLASGISPKK